MKQIAHYHWHLAGKRRSAGNNKALGRSLAFIAGALNAGGFLLIHQFTSHMTGIVSFAADSVATGNWASAMSMLFYICSFVSGAMITTVMVIWARQHHLHSQYVLPMLLEGTLLLGLSLTGEHFQIENGEAAIIVIALLCFLMGLHNAVITKISRNVIRTTHVTGMITDIGIEMGRAVYDHIFSNRNTKPDNEKVELYASIIGMFLLGGVYGGLGFKHFAFFTALPLATYLLFVCFFPLRRDIILRRYLQLRQKRK